MRLVSEVIGTVCKLKAVNISLWVCRLLASGVLNRLSTDVPVSRKLAVCSREITNEGLQLVGGECVHLLTFSCPSHPCV